MVFTIARCQLAACPDFASATFLLEKPTNGVTGRQPDVRPSVELCGLYQVNFGILWHALENIICNRHAFLGSKLDRELLIEL